MANKTKVRPVDFTRYQDAAALCKLDYLGLCDGAAGNACVCPGSEVGVNGRLDFVSISTQARVKRFGKKKEKVKPRNCCMSVFMVCESQRGRVSETEQGCI